MAAVGRLPGHDEESVNIVRRRMAVTIPSQGRGRESSKSHVFIIFYLDRPPQLDTFGQPGLPLPGCLPSQPVHTHTQTEKERKNESLTRFPFYTDTKVVVPFFQQLTNVTSNRDSFHQHCVFTYARLFFHRKARFVLHIWRRVGH